MAARELVIERNLTARDVMQYQVVSVPPEATIRELVQILTEEGISGAPVLDGKGKIVGVVSATDVLRMAAHDAEIPAGQLAWDPVLAPEEEEEGAYFLLPEAPIRFTAPPGDAFAESTFDAIRVREIMTSVAFSVRPDAALGEVIRLFVRGRIHRVLVVENGMLLGIISPFDILQRLPHDELD